MGGTGSGGNSRSSFVGFSMLNGGDISFGGSNSMGFNFSSGAGGIRIGGSTSDGAIGGNTTGKL